MVYSLSSPRVCCRMNAAFLLLQAREIYWGAIRIRKKWAGVEPITVLSVTTTVSVPSPLLVTVWEVKVGPEFQTPEIKSLATCGV